MKIWDVFATQIFYVKSTFHTGGKEELGFAKPKGKIISFQGMKPRGLKLFTLKVAIYPEGWNSLKDAKPIFSWAPVTKMHFILWNHRCFYIVSVLEKDLVKSPDFTRCFPSIGKFFPWEEFFNASIFNTVVKWFHEIFSKNVQKLQKIHLPELFSITVYGMHFYNLRSGRIWFASFKLGCFHPSG